VAACRARLVIAEKQHAAALRVAGAATIERAARRLAERQAAMRAAQARLAAKAKQVAGKAARAGAPAGTMDSR